RGSPHRGSGAPSPLRGLRSGGAQGRARAHRARRRRWARRSRRARPRGQDAGPGRLPVPAAALRTARLRVPGAGPARRAGGPCPPRQGADRYRAHRIGGSMSKKRVYEIAKEQGLSSKELLERLTAAGVDAKAASSSVDEAAAMKALDSDGAARASDANRASASAPGATASPRRPPAQQRPAVPPSPPA